MSRIIKILPGEEENPEFAPEKTEQEGIECKGYLLMTFDEENELASMHMHDISTKELTEAIQFNKDEEVISCLRQAVAVAEGYIRAAEIWKKQRAGDKLGKLLRIFEGDDGEDDD